MPQFNTGTRSQPLGDKKAGISGDLDALAAYVASLNTFAPSPYRNADGSLTAAAVAGRALFISKNCASCHGGTAFTNSGQNNPQNIGTITPASGKRLGGDVDRHRYSDAARCLGDRAVPASWIRGDAGRCDPGACRHFNHRPGAFGPRGLRIPDREPGDRCAGELHRHRRRPTRVRVSQAHISTT